MKLTPAHKTLIRLLAEKAVSEEFNKPTQPTDKTDNYPVRTNRDVGEHLKAG